MAFTHLFLNHESIWLDEVKWNFIIRKNHHLFMIPTSRSRCDIQLPGIYPFVPLFALLMRAQSTCYLTHDDIKRGKKWCINRNSHIILLWYLNVWVKPRGFSKAHLVYVALSRYVDRRRVWVLIGKCHQRQSETNILYLLYFIVYLRSNKD